MKIPSLDFKEFLMIAGKKFINNENDANLQRIIIFSPRDSLQIKMELCYKIKLAGTVNKLNQQKNLPAIANLLQKTSGGTLHFDEEKNEASISKTFVFYNQKDMLNKIKEIEEDENDTFDESAKKALVEESKQLCPSKFDEDMAKMLYDYLCDLKNATQLDNLKNKKLDDSFKDKLLNRIHIYVKSLQDQEKKIEFRYWVVKNSPLNIVNKLTSHKLAKSSYEKYFHNVQNLMEDFQPIFAKLLLAEIFNLNSSDLNTFDRNKLTTLCNCIDYLKKINLSDNNRKELAELHNAIIDLLYKKSPQISNQSMLARKLTKEEEEKINKNNLDIKNKF